MQYKIRNFAAMISKSNRERIKGGDWPDAEWPSYIPKYHLHDFAAIDFEAANGEVTSACSVGVVIVRDDEIVTFTRPKYMASSIRTRKMQKRFLRFGTKWRTSWKVYRWWHMAFRSTSVC